MINADKALQRIDQTENALAVIGDFRTDLDGILSFIESTPGELEFKSTCLSSTNGRIFNSDTVSITIGDKTISTEIHLWAAEKVGLGALCYMREGNYVYAEHLLKEGISFKGQKTEGKAINEKNKKLLVLLALSQYAQGKYASATKTALKSYDADHKKAARNLVAQMAVKLDTEIEKIYDEYVRLTYGGYVRLSVDTANKLAKEKEKLLYLRAYVGRTLNYMKGNFMLFEAKEKSK